VKPFEQVVRDHGTVVLRVCRALLGTVDADDAWSETFLAAMQAYPGLDPGANVRAWLITIAHRKAIDRFRASARAPLPVESLPDRPSSLGNPTEPDDELWAAVRSLPDKQRASVAYHYLADLPYRDIGRLLGISEAAARRNAADGIAALRKTYQGAQTP
jgi:RNA polymerase sigma factor (sigma-70 family)